MTLEIDRLSMLVNVPGAVTILQLENALRTEKLTLGISLQDPSISIAEWLARGAPGAASQFDDPADHLVAGFTVTLVNGRRLEIHPSPRRAVGPDLTALVMGANERFATVETAWLRVHDLGADRVREPFSVLDAPLNEGETALLDAIARALAEA
jgi:FAD/FMN-containing dehydrogenase